MVWLVKSSNIVLLLLSISLGLGWVEGLHPVILVPGDGGSQLDAKLDKPSVVHYLCTRKTDDYFNIWLNMELLVPVIIDCWIDNVRLVYNYTTKMTENSPGVEIRVPGFGNTSTVEFLDPSKASPGLYFKQIVENSLIPLGYIRGNDIRGAPFDFRKAPNEMDEWMKDFQSLIEDSYIRGGNQSVILLSHSMGGPIALYLLQKMKQTWKDKYVKAVISLAAPWGGSMKAWKVFAAGDDLGVVVLPAHTLRGMQRTSPSTSFLLPSKHFWDENEILVSCPGKGNYTLNDMEKFFNDMEFPVGYEMYENTKDLLNPMTPPGVEVHCLHGVGVSTVETMSYKNEDNFPDKPILTFGNGDGTVNVRSLRGCMNWSSTPSKKWKSKKSKKMPVWKTAKQIFHEEYAGVDHMEILKDPRVISYIRDVVQRINVGA